MVAHFYFLTGLLALQFVLICRVTNEEFEACFVFG